MKKRISPDLYILIFKYIPLIVFILSGYFVILYSDYPVWKLPFGLAQIFVHTGDMNRLIYDTLFAYIGGYIVYLITTVIPAIIRNIPMNKRAAKDIFPVYEMALYYLLLMYKNTCNQNQWDALLKKNIKTDFDCFDDDFYKIIKLFNLNSNSDTIYLDKETKQPIRWKDFLNNLTKSMYEDINSCIILYGYYIDEAALDGINNLKTCTFVQAFSGHFIDTECKSEAADGQVYHDPAPLDLLSEQGNYAIFEETRMIKEYVEALRKVLKFLDRFYSHKLPRDLCISKLRDEHVGRVGTAILNYRPDNEG